MHLKAILVGSILAVAPLSFDGRSCDVARAQACYGDQCPAGDSDALGRCYDGCDWALAGQLVFCQVVSPDVVTRAVCQSIAHNEWSNCYRNCL